MSCVAQGSRQYIPFPADMATDPPAGVARICLIRPERSTGAALVYMAYDGSQLVGDLFNGGYICWQRKEGQALIKADWRNTMFGDRGRYFSVTLPVTGGGSYFLLVEPSFGHGDVKSISFKEAQQHMAQYPSPQTAQAASQPTGKAAAPNTPGSEPVGVKDSHPRPSGSFNY